MQLEPRGTGEAVAPDAPGAAGAAGAPGVTLTSCRVREILERVGDKWSLFVISCLGEGPRRFTALKREVGGISQRMLTVTLRGLERDGIVSRTMYPVMPPRVDYELTPLGRTLLDAVGALMAWADARLDEVDAARAAYDARAAAQAAAQAADLPWPPGPAQRSTAPPGSAQANPASNTNPASNGSRAGGR